MTHPGTMLDACRCGTPLRHPKDVACGLCPACAALEPVEETVRAWDLLIPPPDVRGGKRNNYSPNSMKHPDLFDERLIALLSVRRQVCFEKHTVLRAMRELGLEFSVTRKASNQHPSLGHDRIVPRDFVLAHVPSFDDGWVPPPEIHAGDLFPSLEWNGLPRNAGGWSLRRESLAFVDRRGLRRTIDQLLVLAIMAEYRPTYPAVHVPGRSAPHLRIPSW
jgi:hypothetical protein